MDHDRYVSDVPFLWKMLRLKWALLRVGFVHRGIWSIADLFEGTARRFPQREALEFEQRTWTYGELDRISNQAAHRAFDRGIRADDIVGITAINHPAVVWHLIGLAKIGVTISVLRPDHVASLDRDWLDRHGIRLILSAEHLVGALTKSVDSSRVAVLEEEDDLRGYPAGDPRTVHDRDVRWTDTFLHLSTSGTQGRPKLVSVTHSHLYAYLLAQRWMKGLLPSDVIYCCLPLSHGMGLASSLMSSWTVGAKVYLVDRFDPDRCFEDCARHHVTVLTYVGLTPRMLLATEPTPHDRAHSVRVAVGHEMDGSVWNRFAERFGISSIVEFYGATDGPALLINAPGRVGAAGYLGPLTSRFYPVALVRLGGDGDPARGDGGLCIRCVEGERGELIVPYSTSDPTLEFPEYVDPHARASGERERRIIRDVFKKGDLWTRTGDAFHRDREGFFYFAGRVSDVLADQRQGHAAAEIERAVYAAAGNDDFIRYCRVYPVPSDSAGAPLLMATVVAGRRFAVAELYERLATSLGAGTLPRVVRVKRDFGDMTPTFRMSRQKLVREGCDPDAVSDPLYLCDDASRKYVPLDASRSRAAAPRTLDAPLHDR